VGIRAITDRLVGRGEVTRAGAYELRVRLLHRGTRSQGRIGRLYRNGVEVPGHEVGEVVDGGTHRFVFLGSDRPHPWSVSGWCADAEPGADGSAADGSAAPTPPGR
jgi:hypothetical protein